MKNTALAIHDAGKRFQTAKRKLFWDSVFSVVRDTVARAFVVRRGYRLRCAWQQVEGRQAEISTLDRPSAAGPLPRFHRAFLPRVGQRVALKRGVDAAMNSMAGLPPIEAIRSATSVWSRTAITGSVAHANGFKEIEAYVTRVRNVHQTGLDTTPEDLVLKAAHAVLSATFPGRLRPDFPIWR